MKELARRLGPDSNVVCNAVHPGGITGKFNKPIVGNSVFLNALDDTFQAGAYWSEEQGALTVLGPAISPKILGAKISGKYFIPIARPAPCSTYGNDMELAKKLWEFSEGLLKEKGYDAM